MENDILEIANKKEIDWSIVRNNLYQHVHYLSVHIGERNLWKEGSLGSAVDYIKKIFDSYNIEVESQSFITYRKNVSNLILIDRKGYIRYMSSGPAESPAIDRFFNEIDVLERSR